MSSLHTNRRDAGHADGVLLAVSLVALYSVVVYVRWGWVGLGWLLVVHLACLALFALMVVVGSEDPERGWRDRGQR